MAKISLIYGLVLLMVAMVARDSDSAPDYISWEDFLVDEGKIIVVDQSGHGDSLTVQGAVDMIPEHNTERTKIYIYPGIYRERVYIPRSKPYISLIGKPKTIMTYGDMGNLFSEFWNALPVITNSTDSEKVFDTATVFAESDFFCATSLAIENLIDKSESERRAVALRVDSPKAVLYRVKLVGEQDTLLDNIGTHYYFKSYIEGSVDFIFGSAKSWFQQCIIHTVAKPWGSITAHRRNSLKEDAGFLFDRCTITGTGCVILGRPWGPYATTVYSLCYMDDNINPLGWNDWDNSTYQTTAMYGEYNNNGKGADPTNRVKWSKVFQPADIRTFLSINYINRYTWLRL